jgi:formylglycine-generating enzyme required for sulfatase activity
MQGRRRAFFVEIVDMRRISFFCLRTTRSRLLSVAACALATFSFSCGSSHAGTVTFGSGANQFSMEFVTIGNPGNAADTSGAPNPAGAVGYEYGIGKFEVSEDMINKFNASQSLQITMDSRGTNKPATSVSWNEAARFVNWLNTSTGGVAAYKFTTTGVNDDIEFWQSGDAGYDASNPYRNSLAKYVLPSYNEWYKAAYYDPSNSTYYNYATGSDFAPTQVASGTGADTAVYGAQSGPADVDQAGGLSPYGVMGLGGNAREWEESSFDLANSSVSSSRGSRGGHWGNAVGNLSSTLRRNFLPSLEDGFNGFRVVTLSPGGGEVPEPTSMAIFGLGALGFAYRNRRKLMARDSQRAINDTLAS